jgi:hypothetical protein
MAILHHPDSPCSACGDRPLLRLHPDGSIRSAVHDCPTPPPGPPDAPLSFRPGEWQPQDGATLMDAVQDAQLDLAALDRRITAAEQQHQRELAPLREARRILLGRVLDHVLPRSE